MYLRYFLSQQIYDGVEPPAVPISQAPAISDSNAIAIEQIAKDNPEIIQTAIERNNEPSASATISGDHPERVAGKSSEPLEAEAPLSSQPLANASSRSGSLLPHSQRDPHELRPAEIAYLVRGGDSTHALIVLAADLTQRALRKEADLSFTQGLTDYERRMWHIVSGSVKSWATKTAKDKVLGDSRDPVKIAKRLYFIYNFVRFSLGKVLTDVLRDPKQLKKYFSYAGFIRILADFGAAGYKMKFEEELHRSLLRRGLLVPEQKRLSVSRWFWIAGLAGLLSSAIITVLYSASMPVAWATFVTACFAAFAGRTILSLRQFIPLYEELGVVVDQVERKSFRLAVVRNLLRSVNVIVWLATTVVVLSIGLIGLGIVRLVYAAAGSAEIFSWIGVFIANYAVADLMFEGLKLSVEQYPTGKALTQLKQLKKELAGRRPLHSFSDFLSSQQYDPELSKLLALYGIEAVLILA